MLDSAISHASSSFGTLQFLPNRSPELDVSSSVMFNGQQLFCNSTDIENCIRECARSFPAADQAACVSAVEYKFAPYPACFEGSTTVIVKGVGAKRISDLIPHQDFVLDASLQFSPVIGWLHRDDLAEADFITLTSECGVYSVSLTGDHLLFDPARNEYVVASQITSFETRFVDGSTSLAAVSSREESRKTKKSRGLFSPLTASGTLLVNGGIHASCYAAPRDVVVPISHEAAHSVFSFFVSKLGFSPDQLGSSLFHLFSRPQIAG